MYDVIIIGGGAAGLTAAAYCARGGLGTLLAEKLPACGGQLNLTDRIANFPSCDVIGGYELAERLKNQAAEAGAELITADVARITDGQIKRVTSSAGEYSARALIYAAGAEHRKLGIKGETELAGRGVSYCAVCDGGFFRGKTVSVIGGGDTALSETLYLSAICDKVYLIHRRREFRGSAELARRCEGTGNIVIMRETVPLCINGDKSVTGLTLQTDGLRQDIECSGVFIAAGMSPVTEMVKDICRLDENGYIIASEDCITSAAGIFAAGDVRTKPLRQIVTACADGAAAAFSAEKYIREA